MRLLETHLPVPINPAIGEFIGAGLGLVKLSQESLIGRWSVAIDEVMKETAYFVGCRKRARGSCERLAISNGRIGAFGAIVARANSTTVQVFGAIILRQSIEISFARRRSANREGHVQGR